MKPFLKPMILCASAVLFSSGAQATLFTQGNLVYDDTTGIISGDGYEYLGFGIGANWTYAETIAATSPGGAYESFSIALTADADRFIKSLLGGADNPCSVINGIDNGRTTCGTLTGWTDNKFGTTFEGDADLVWFEADESTTDAGYVLMRLDGVVDQIEGGTSYAVTDQYAAGGGIFDAAAPWLLVREAASTGGSVPNPSVFALFALGLAGLRVARRSKAAFG